MGARDRDAQVAERPFRDARLGGLGVELEARTLGEPVGDLEADVVARVRIPVARVTETDDETVGAWRRGAREELGQTDQDLSSLSRVDVSRVDAEKGLHRKRRWGPAGRLSVTRIA